jgi:hypothetical protein
VLALDGDNVKALYRRGVAVAELGEFDAATEDVRTSHSAALRCAACLAHSAAAAAQHATGTCCTRCALHVACRPPPPRRALGSRNGPVTDALT